MIYKGVIFLKEIRCGSLFDNACQNPADICFENYHTWYYRCLKHWPNKSEIEQYDLKHSFCGQCTGLIRGQSAFSWVCGIHYIIHIRKYLTY